MINRYKESFTRVTSAKKAYEIKRILKRENRFTFLVKYTENTGTVAYYIFYYNYK